MQEPAHKKPKSNNTAAANSSTQARQLFSLTDMRSKPSESKSAVAQLASFANEKIVFDEASWTLDGHYQRKANDYVYLFSHNKHGHSLQLHLHTSSRHGQLEHINLYDASNGDADKIHIKFSDEDERDIAHTMYHGGVLHSQGKWFTP